MNHSSMEELTQAVHGLGPTPAHLELCAECLETVDRLREERDLLRRADARLAVPLPKRRLGSLLPLALAAAALLAVTGVIVLPQDPLPPAVPAEGPQESADLAKLIDLFLDGTDKESARARELLVDSARSALPALVDARHTHPASLRPDALSALILDLKRKAAGPAGDPIFKALHESMLTVSVKGVPASRALASIASVCNLACQVDPELEDFPVDLDWRDTPATQVLNVLGLLHNLDYDVRFGILFFARPKRLFDVPSGRRSSPVNKPIPREGHWRRQELSAAGTAIVNKLDTLTINLDFENTSLTDVLVFLRDLAGVTFMMQPGIDGYNTEVTIKAKGYKAASALELLLLPRHLDVSIEDNIVYVFRKQ